MVMNGTPAQFDEYRLLFPDGSGDYIKLDDIDDIKMDMKDRNEKSCLYFFSVQSDLASF